MKDCLENGNVIIKITVNKHTTIYWYREKYDQYRVRVLLYNREIYNKVLDEKHYKIYFHFINERITFLSEMNILDKDYLMILLDGTMYKVLDACCHFKNLLRLLVPIGGIEYDDVRDHLFDLVLDATLRTGEAFGETDLVYHNGVFYNNGNKLKDIKDFERDGIEYEKFDLLHGITNEQLEYLVADYYSRDFTNYITSEVNLKIDKWY